jgi:hypothetical protein
VQILGGGRTEEAATNIATLSGSLNLKDKTFTSASNFMIIKFRSDEVSVYFGAVFRIRIEILIHRIHMFLGISQRYGSGSGSLYQQAKIVRKTFIPTVL